MVDIIAINLANIRQKIKLMNDLNIVWGGKSDEPDR